MSDQHPQQGSDIIASGRDWLERADRGDDRVLARTGVGEAVVSTVFLGTNHNLPGVVPLYETTIFGGEHGGRIWRYPTRDEAQQGHHRVAAALQAGTDPDET